MLNVYSPNLSTDLIRILMSDSLSSLQKKITLLIFNRRIIYCNFKCHIHVIAIFSGCVGMYFLEFYKTYSIRKLVPVDGESIQFFLLGTS